MPDSIERRRRALRDAVPRWRPSTLDGFLDRCAAAFPDRPMVLTDERTVSYPEVAAWSRRLAGGLTALGVRPGDRVGMVMANHLEFTPVKFAIARTGAVAVPFNYLYRAAELGYVLRQSGCSVLITMTRFGELDYPAMLDEIAPGWETGAAAALPALRAVVQLDTGGGLRPGVRTLADLEAAGADPGTGGAGGGHAPEDLGDILYTSGTTGSPKGVMVTHDAVLRTGYASALTRAFEDGRRILFALPCYHMFGYVEGLLATMVVGGAIVPRPVFSPADQLAAVERHRATEILCVPTMTVALLEHPDRHTRDLSSLFAMLCGAAPAPTWVWRRVRAELGVSEITTGYGMTECGGAMTMTLPEDPLERHSETVGRPKLAGAAGLTPAELPAAGFPGREAGPLDGGAICRYRAHDPGTGAELAPGREGELASTGPTHMLGFWDEPEETAAALRDGWVYSGDLGRVGEDGYLRLTGRTKELYKSGGELVMPKEVEELIGAVPGVSQVYVVGVPDERWGEAGCAWIVPEPGASVDLGGLRDLCRDRLARFKVPKHLLVIPADELPTTPTGKVQKFRLVERAAHRLRC